jgi:hypothetical protein
MDHAPLLLLALAALSGATKVVVICIAIRGAKPADRAEIIRAVAELFRWRRTEPPSARSARVASAKAPQEVKRRSKAQEGALF